MPEVKLIAAIDDHRGIAKEHKIPWNLPTDQHYFRAKLASGPVVMGYNTYVSNGLKPFSGYENFVFSRQGIQAPNVTVKNDLIDFFENLHEDIWVAGGGQIFAASLPYASRLYLTRVRGNYGCDIFFPEFEDDFSLESAEEWQTENSTEFRFEIWSPKD